MPMPVSRTSARSHSEPSRAIGRIARTTSPSSVNLTALPTRLLRICRSRTGSPRIWRGRSSERSHITSSDFSCAGAAISWMTSSASWQIETGIRSSVSLPASIFEKSRMSLMITRSASPERWTVSASCRCWPVRRVASRSSDIPITPFIGVRISWLMFARNCDFDRFASSAASLASRNACSDRRMSVMSETYRWNRSTSGL